jgi:charged multivesicular body protein 6
LKKKKFLEKNLDNTDKQLDNLEQMAHSIEFKQIEIQVMNGLKVGNDCLKNLNLMLSLDDVEQIMDDTKEAVDYQYVKNYMI